MDSHHHRILKKIENVCLPSAAEKAEAFAKIFTNVSSPEGLAQTDLAFREKEEKNEAHDVPFPDNSNNINAPITIQEVKEAIRVIPIKKSSVGLDAISNQMLRNLPDNL